MIDLLTENTMLSRSPALDNMSVKEESSDPETDPEAEELRRYIERNLRLRPQSSYFAECYSRSSFSLPQVHRGSLKSKTALSRTESMPLSAGTRWRGSGKASGGRKYTSTGPPGMRRHRRCSEPFYPHGTGRTRKSFPPSLEGKGQLRRRGSSVNSALQIPNATKLKLQELAKDELLASLSVPSDDKEEDPIVEEREEVDNLALIEEEERRQLRELKRLKVIEEIFETEKKYISCLDTLDKVFRTPMLDGGIAAEKDVRALFPPCLSTIRECHSWFMTELENRIHNDEWKGSIGDVFGNLSGPLKNNLLEVYTNYVNAFPKSISTFSKCTRGSNKFRKFIEECYDKSDNLDLPSYLITPVQRLPRYVLLLRQLSKYTTEEHPDLDSIKEALQQMEELIQTLNGAIQNSMLAYTSRDTDNRRSFRRQLSKRRKKPRSVSNDQKEGKHQEENKEKKPRTVSPTSPLSPLEEKPRGRTISDLDSRDDDVFPGNGENKLQNRRSASADDLSMPPCPSASPNNHGVVLRNKSHEFSRNSEVRKSWRRSIGSKLASLWSPKEDKPEPLFRKPSEEQILEDCDEVETETTNEPTADGTDSPAVRRKVGVFHERPSSCNEGFISTEDEEKLRDIGNELNNNKRRKFSGSFRDKTKNLKISLRRRSLTLPAGVTEDYLLKTQGHVTSGNERITGADVASNVVTESSDNNTTNEEKGLEDNGSQMSPNLKRNNKARSSGRSPNLMSLFQKRKTKHQDDEVDTPESTLKIEELKDSSSSERLNSPIKEETKLHSSKCSNSKKNKVKKHEVKDDSNSPIENNEGVDDLKNASKSRESHGKWKKAFKHIVGKRKA